MKPYAVKVTIGTKINGKEFDTKWEMDEFLEKVEALKAKAPQLEVEIIRNGPVERKPKSTTILDTGKEECIAWIRVERGGIGMTDHLNRQLYQSVPVPPKKGVKYCPYCHGYKPFNEVDLSYGNKGIGCCGITIDDFHMKTVNGGWNK